MIDELKALLNSQQHPELAKLELAVLVGSRALQTCREDSDWDIAIRWHKNTPAIEALSLSAALQINIAKCLNVIPEKIDLIHIPSAKLAMRANIAEEGLILKGEDTLAWSHFLTQTWAELEEYYRRANHAA